MYWYLWQFYTILERYSIWILATIIKKVLFLYQEDFQKHIKRTMQLTNFFFLNYKQQHSIEIDEDRNKMFTKIKWHIGMNTGKWYCLGITVH